MSPVCSNIVMSELQKGKYTVRKIITRGRYTDRGSKMFFPTSKTKFNLG